MITVPFLRLFLQILLPNELPGIVFQTKGLPDAVADSLQLGLHMGRGEEGFVAGLGGIFKDPGAVLDFKAHGVGVDEPAVVAL